jgi:hypothetical protein
MKGYIMSLLNKITQWFKTVFATTQYEELDAYIASKNPTTTAEVEYWINNYDRIKLKGVLIWRS